jgi:hypothetical protein
MSLRHPHPRDHGFCGPPRAAVPALGPPLATLTPTLGRAPRPSESRKTHDPSGGSGVMYHDVVLDHKLMYVACLGYAFACSSVGSYLASIVAKSMVNRIGAMNVIYLAIFVQGGRLLIYSLVVYVHKLQFSVQCKRLYY